MGEEKNKNNNTNDGKDMKIDINGEAASAFIVIALILCISTCKVVTNLNPCSQLLEQRSQLITNNLENIKAIAEVDSLIICVCKTK